jgi:glycosyltransferase involved in cell wall biosynthesis
METGLLADDSDQFYDKLKMIIESPTLAKHIGNAGRAQIEREFSVEVVGTKLAMILHQFSK